MNRAPSLAAIALGLALAGCGPVNRGVATVHQPVVTRADYTLDVGVDANGLRYGEERRLNAWFESLHLGYGDRVAVDDPAPSAGHRVAIAEAASHYGVLVNPTPPITEGAVAPGTVRVIITRSTAEVPFCPDWRRESQPEFEASTTSNFGCAVNSNFAQMVANPQDLIVGQTGSPTRDSRTVAKALKSYRDYTPSGAGGTVDKATIKEVKQ